MVEARAAELETAQALKRVIPPGAVVDPITDRLAKLAVARDVDPERLLMADDILHRPAQCLLKRAIVDRLASFARPVGLDQVVGTRQATGVAGQDVVGAGSHGSAPQLTCGECGTLRQGVELGPGDVGVDAAADPAI